MRSVNAIATSTRPRPVEGAGVSLIAYAAAAWLAAVFARALSPALPGSAVGIAELIWSTRFGAACASQLVAAGGIALCIRLLGTVLPLPGLGVGLRMLIAPTTLAVVALVVSAATRPLDPTLSSVLGVAAAVALLAPAPLLFSGPETRLAAVVLTGAGIATGCDVLAMELGRKGDTGGPEQLAAAALVLDLALAALAIASRARRGSRLTASVLAFTVLVLVPVAIAAGGDGHAASGIEVLFYRSLEALSDPWPLLLPTWLEHTATLVPFAASAVLIVLCLPRDDLAVALALCLLGRTAPGAPIATLLSAGAALLATRVFYVSFRRGAGARDGSARQRGPRSAPSDADHARPNAASAPSTTTR
ncbi:MAG TPA: hypothetical protein VKY73_22280 [Polyangiaceae bacterium]|nr:hypothetical protein [Polyangiaceae bacterium]